MEFTSYDSIVSIESNIIGYHYDIVSTRIITKDNSIDIDVFRTHLPLAQTAKRYDYTMYSNLNTKQCYFVPSKSYYDTKCGLPF